MNGSDLKMLVAEAADLILSSNKLVVFTGAGISTESGIPDFRSPGGIWERFDPDDFTYSKFISSKDSRRMQWHLFREGLLSDKAVPNAAHIAIADLYKMGRLDCVITQNIDNLHQKAGVPDDMVYELHGNMKWARCLECGRRYPFEEIKGRLEQGEEIPDCIACRGMLKPDIVMFEEQLPVDLPEGKIELGAFAKTPVDFSILDRRTIRKFNSVLTQKLRNIHKEVLFREFKEISHG